MMKTLAWIAFDAALAACGTPPRPVAPAPAAASAPPVAADAPAAAAQARPVAAEATAGLYWRPYVSCETCERPVAVVAYVAPDVDGARRIAAALGGTLPLGRPFVVHTDQLGGAAHGIAVVTGAYGTAQAARAAAAQLPAIAGQRALARPVGSDDDGGGQARRFVTVVDRGPPVAAWSPADLNAAKAALDAASVEPGTDTARAMLLAQLRTRPPRCTVHAGDVFVVTDAEIDWYVAAPVRCGGELAYIPWTSSLLGHAVILPDGAGHRLYQITGAECDSPIVESWAYDAAGRHGAPREELAPPDDAAAP